MRVYFERLEFKMGRLHKKNSLPQTPYFYELKPFFGPNRVVLVKWNFYFFQTPDFYELKLFYFYQIRWWW